VGQIIWSKEAISDVENIHAYYREVSLVYADNLVESYFSRVETLTTLPMLGRIVPEFGEGLLRELVDRRSRIMYEVVGEEQTIRIMRVYLTSQRIETS